MWTPNAGIGANKAFPAQAHPLPSRPVDAQFPTRPQTVSLVPDSNRPSHSSYEPARGGWGTSSSRDTLVRVDNGTALTSDVSSVHTQTTCPPTSSHRLDGTLTRGVDRRDQSSASSQSQTTSSSLSHLATTRSGLDTIAPVVPAGCTQPLHGPSTGTIHFPLVSSSPLNSSAVPCLPISGGTFANVPRVGVGGGSGEEGVGRHHDGGSLLAQSILGAFGNQSASVAASGWSATARIDDPAPTAVMTRGSDDRRSPVMGSERRRKPWADIDFSMEPITAGQDNFLQCLRSVTRRPDLTPPSVEGAEINLLFLFTLVHIQGGSACVSTAPTL